MTILGALITAAVAGAGTGLLAKPILRWCPEPANSDGKPRTYRALATSRFQVGGGLVAAAAALTACTVVPLALLPLWLVGATLGVLLALVDATLTWVPARLNHLAWAATALSLVGVRLLDGSWALIASITVTALAVTLAFLLVWRISYPNLGFADVRFAPVVAAIGASSGLTQLVAAVLCTTVVAILHHLVLRGLGRHGLQPYTPAMLAGPFLAAIVAAAVR